MLFAKHVRLKAVGAAITCRKAWYRVTRVVSEETRVVSNLKGAALNLLPSVF